MPVVSPVQEITPGSTAFQISSTLLLEFLAIFPNDTGIADDFNNKRHTVTHCALVGSGYVMLGG